MTGIILNQY